MVYFLSFYTCIRINCRAFSFVKPGKDCFLSGCWSCLSDRQFSGRLFPRVLQQLNVSGYIDVQCEATSVLGGESGR